jgi:hypothetical protein
LPNTPIIVREECTCSPIGYTWWQWHLFETEEGLGNYIQKSAVPFVLDELLGTALAEDAIEAPALSDIIKAAYSAGGNVDESTIALARRIAEGGESVEDSWKLLVEGLVQESSYCFARFNGFMGLATYLEEVGVEIEPDRLRKADSDRSIANEILEELAFG